jgi:hypothetical protein
MLNCNLTAHNFDETNVITNDYSDGRVRQFIATTTNADIVLNIAPIDQLANTAPLYSNYTDSAKAACYQATSSTTYVKNNYCGIVSYPNPDAEHSDLPIWPQDPSVITAWNDTKSDISYDVKSHTPPTGTFQWTFSNAPTSSEQAATTIMRYRAAVYFNPPSASHYHWVFILAAVAVGVVIFGGLIGLVVWVY